MMRGVSRELWVEFLNGMWTKEPPKKPGTYYVRRKGESYAKPLIVFNNIASPPELVYVSEGFGGEWEFAKEADFWWWSVEIPLMPDPPKEKKS